MLFLQGFSACNKNYEKLLIIFLNFYLISIIQFFYPNSSDLTIRITPFRAEREGMLAPREVMEEAYIRTVPASARQRNLDFYIPSGFEAKIYDEELTEDSSTICVVYVGYYSAGELLSISVWSTNKDEGEQALNILNTIRK